MDDAAIRQKLSKLEGREMSEPVFTVPLNLLVEIEPLGPWSCWVVGCDEFRLSNGHAEARAAAVEHLAEAHGLVGIWEGRELRAGDTTEIHYEGSRRSATVWHLGNSTGPLIVVPDEDGATDG